MDRALRVSGDIPQEGSMAEDTRKIDAAMAKARELTKGAYDAANALFIQRLKEQNLREAKHCVFQMWTYSEKMRHLTDDMANEWQDRSKKAWETVETLEAIINLYDEYKAWPVKVRGSK